MAIRKYFREFGEKVDVSLKQLNKTINDIIIMKKCR